MLTACSKMRIMVLLSVLVILAAVESCNEAVCASVVSKCMLTQSCKCDLKNCSCCKECFSCLSHLYSECCSCVDMCPKSNDSGNALGKKSHVEEFNDSYPSLFAALTNEPDPINRWVSFTFVVNYTSLSYSPQLNKEMKYHTHSVEQNITFSSNPEQKNCTVVFINECTSWKKCSDTCQSMGSASYRWFHDGCCECVGPWCLNYGISDSRCKNCLLESYMEGDEEYDIGNDYVGVLRFGIFDSSIFVKKIKPFEAVDLYIKRYGCKITTTFQTASVVQSSLLKTIGLSMQGHKI